MRRNGLEQSVVVVLDLLVEALFRLGISYQPGEGEPAVAALEKAPDTVRELVARLIPIAVVPQGQYQQLAEETVEEDAVPAAVEPCQEVAVLPLAAGAGGVYGVGSQVAVEDVPHESRVEQLREELDRLCARQRVIEDVETVSEEEAARLEAEDDEIRFRKSVIFGELEQLSRSRFGVEPGDGFYFEAEDEDDEKVPDDDDLEVSEVEGPLLERVYDYEIAEGMG